MPVSHDTHDVHGAYCDCLRPRQSSVVVVLFQDGIQAILTSSATDVLSHIAIRARAQGVLLATCFDGEELKGIEELVGAMVVATVLPTGAVEVVKQVEDGTAVAAKGAGGAGGPAKKIVLQRPPNAALNAPAWVITEDQFQDGMVGGKARNLATLRLMLPDR